MPQEWRVENFERGITDNYIDGARNQARTMDNLLIDKNRKIYSRPGSSLFEESASANVLPGQTRIDHIKLFDDVLFEFSDSSIFYREDDAGTIKYNEFRFLTGEGINTSLPLASTEKMWRPAVGSPTLTNPRNDSDEWQSHLYVTLSGDNDYYRPRKIWRDEDGNLQARTAGLPDPSDVNNFSQANGLFNSLVERANSHEENLGATPNGHLTNGDYIDIGLQNSVFTVRQLIDKTILLRDQILAHIADSQSGSFVHHHFQITDLDQILGNTTDPTSFIEVNALLNELLEVWNNHQDGGHGTANGIYAAGSELEGLPKVISKSSSDPSSVYIYNLVYKRKYQVGNVTYIDRSTPWEFSLTGPITMGPAEFIKFQGLVTLGSTFLGDKEVFQQTLVFPPSEVKLEFYRTEKNGTIPKFVSELNADDVFEFEDRTADADLGIVVYTQGGVSGAGMVPLCKYLTQSQDIMWYANVRESAEDRPYRVRQSFQFDPDGCPESYFVDVDDDITGISSVNIFPIVFTASKTYRFEGFVDQLGRGFTKKRIVDQTVGCLGNNSIVRVKDRLYFAGNDGFYVTDGFKVTKISQHLDDTYKLFTKTADQKRRIYGTFDQENDLVYWAVTSEEAITENDKIYVHDIHWGLPNNEGTFTTYSAGLNFQPSSLAVVDGDLVRADGRGYTFRHDEDLATDLIVDVSVTPDNWDDTAVIYDYTSPAWSFGSEYQRKWVTKLLTTVKPVSNVSIQPQSINDDSQLKKNLKEVRERGTFFWGDPLFTWGDPSFAWRSTPISNFIRRFPRDGLRCFYKQVRYTNSFTVLTNSESGGSVTVDATAKTITLTSGTWPTVTGDLIGGEWIPGLDINGVGYTITAATTTELTVSDAGNALVDGAELNWYAKQHIETELFYLNGYTVIYDFFGTGHTHFQPGDSGGLGT